MPKSARARGVANMGTRAGGTLLSSIDAHLNNAGVKKAGCAALPYRMSLARAVIKKKSKCFV